MRPKQDSIGLLANCGGVFLGSARKSLDLHEAEGRAKKHQQPSPDRQEMLLAFGWLRHAQERGLNCWASASSFSCPRCLFVCLTDFVSDVIWPTNMHSQAFIRQAPLPEERVLSANSISKHFTLYFPRFRPHIVNYHATRPHPCWQWTRRWRRLRRPR